MKKQTEEKVTRKKIVLDGTGDFPKKVIIKEPGRVREYTLVKTSSGKYLLN